MYEYCIYCYLFETMIIRNYLLIIKLYKRCIVKIYDTFGFRIQINFNIKILIVFA